MNKLILIVFCVFYCRAQSFTELFNIETDENYENIKVVPLNSSIDLSTYIIFVKNEVASHIHKEHTENVYVISGKALMTVGNETKEIKPGDLIHLPRNTVHSVRVISEIPLKVISIQAPKFIGKDRIFVED